MKTFLRFAFDPLVGIILFVLVVALAWEASRAAALSAEDEAWLTSQSLMQEVRRWDAQIEGVARP